MYVHSPKIVIKQTNFILFSIETSFTKRGNVLGHFEEVVVYFEADLSKLQPLLLSGAA